MKKAVILISGGLDSTTILAYAKSQNFECYCISFDYGQRHKSELQAASNIARLLNAKSHIVYKMGIGDFGGSALTDINIDVPISTVGDAIPVTYVPARNINFLSVALSYAEVNQANDIFIGVSSVDNTNYPDCRPEFIDAFEKTANLATKSGVEEGIIKIHTPLLYLSKSETIKLGLDLGVDYSQTVSCYHADQDGLACGKCHACQLRQNGFEDLGVQDPTRYVKSDTLKSALLYNI